MKYRVQKTLPMILLVFLICELVKDFELLVLKTDQTFLAENIICKVLAIGVIFICLRQYHLTWADIGFELSGILRGAILGLSLGLVTYAVSYLAEYLILQNAGLNPRFSFYITNFSISNAAAPAYGISLSALAVCLLGNLINVWAEEGLFRGLFMRLGKMSYSEKQANLIQAVLFGLWHVIIVVVWFAGGSITAPTAFVMALGYMALAGILGYEWGLCAALTGTIWAGAFEHFFNNFIGNTLHVITDTGADELQIIRILISNVLSLVIVIGLTERQNQSKRAY